MKASRPRAPRPNWGSYPPPPDAERRKLNLIGNYLTETLSSEAKTNLALYGNLENYQVAVSRTRSQF